MDKEILKLIEESKKPFHIEDRRAELLKRNEIFLKELEGISNRLGKEFFKIKELSRKKLEEPSNDNILLKLDYPKVKIKEIDCPVEEAEKAHIYSAYYGYDSDRYDPILEIEKDSFFDSRDIDTILDYDRDLDNIRTKIEFKLTVLDEYKEKWKGFCRKFHIDEKWHGDVSNLSDYQMPLISIGFDGNINLPIYIRFGPWITLEDIKEKWEQVELIRKKNLYKEEKRSNFNRDLCWYDLNKKEGYSPGKIARSWLKSRPEDIDKLVAPKVKKKYKFSKGMSISDFLEVIKSNDPRMKEIRDDFEEEKKIYATGQTEYGKFTPPFTDVIKKAIDRMDKRIKRLDLRPQFREKIFSMPLKKKKIIFIKGKINHS